jgi:hypothetical protein
MDGKGLERSGAVIQEAFTRKEGMGEKKGGENRLCRITVRTCNVAAQ